MFAAEVWLLWRLMPRLAGWFLVRLPNAAEAIEEVWDIAAATAGADHLDHGGAPWQFYTCDHWLCIERRRRLDALQAICPRLTADCLGRKPAKARP
jgi:hypothetical protein